MAQNNANSPVIDSPIQPFSGRHLSTLASAAAQHDQARTVPPTPASPPLPAAQPRSDGDVQAQMVKTLAQMAATLSAQSMTQIASAAAASAAKAAATEAAPSDTKKAEVPQSPWSARRSGRETRHAIPARANDVKGAEKHAAEGQYQEEQSGCAPHPQHC